MHGRNANEAGDAFKDGNPTWRPIQEGNSLLIRGFTTGPKPYEEVLTYLRKGSTLEKYGRHGNPKYHHFRLAADDKELQWKSKGGRIRSVSLDLMKSWERGQGTDVFKRYPQPSKLQWSFSILYTHKDSGKLRTLDVICQNINDFEAFYWGTQVVHYYPPATFYQLAGNQPPPPRPPRRPVPDPVDVTQRSIDAPILSKTPKLPSAPQNANGAAAYNPLAASLPQSVAASMQLGGVGVSQSLDQGRKIGDLYVWGSMALFDDRIAPQSPGVSMLHLDPVHGWQQSPNPVLVHNTGGLNVVAATCGTRHAALISRAGELYTWGYGREGALGHGSLLNDGSPHRVEGRWVQAHEGVLAASAADSCTAAITSGGKLYTWGSGLAGQLGHGQTCAVVPQPKLVRALAEPNLKVLQVSCGPYHTAAITSDGALFTWGSGLFGRLGHGDTHTCYTPRRVAALEDKVVTCVSCGWWHTAAVATARPGAARLASVAPTLATESSQSGHPTAHGSSSAGMDGAYPSRGSVSDLRPEASMTTSVSDSELGSVMNGRIGHMSESGEAWADTGRGGGQLYTWGGDFTWMEPKDVRALTKAASSAAVLGPLSAGVLTDSPQAMQEPLITTQSESAATTGNGTDHARLDRNVSMDGDRWSRQTAGPLTESTEVDRSSLGTRVFKSSKRDNHKGCLGTGDLLGRLSPFRVQGELELKDVVQVACGWNLTVALTRDGRVFQMGGTGAVSEDGQAARGAPWEGCQAPTQVDGALFGLFIEQVSVGMHHVAAVASRLQGSGRLPEEGRRTRLIMWGQGRAGQLGLDGAKDTPTPQVVASLDGRRIVHVACGGNHTLAVCEHDHSKDSHRLHRSMQSSTTTMASPGPIGPNGLSAHGALTPRVQSLYALAAANSGTSGRHTLVRPPGLPPVHGTPAAYATGQGSYLGHPNLTQYLAQQQQQAARSSLVSSSNPVTAFVAQTVDIITTKVGAATTALTSRAHTPSRHGTNNADVSRGSGEYYRQYAQGHGHPRLITVASGYTSESDERRRAARLARSATTLAHHAATTSGQGRGSNPSRPGGRQGISRNPSSSALSTQSSPGLVGGGHGGDPSSRPSPASSISGYDPTSAEVSGTPGRAHSSDTHLQAHDGHSASFQEGSASGPLPGVQERLPHAHAANSGPPVLHLQSDLSGTDTSGLTPAYTPEASPASAHNHTSSPLDPITLSTPQLQPGIVSPTVPHYTGPSWSPESPPPGGDAGVSGEASSPFSAPSGASMAGLAAFGEEGRAVREGTFAAWQTGAAGRYSPPALDGIGGGAAYTLPSSHSLVGRPLPLIDEQGDDPEQPSVTLAQGHTTSTVAAGADGLPGTFELSLCYPTASGATGQSAGGASNGTVSSSGEPRLPPPPGLPPTVGHISQHAPLDRPDALYITDTSSSVIGHADSLRHHLALGSSSVFNDSVSSSLRATSSLVHATPSFHAPPHTHSPVGSPLGAGLHPRASPASPGPWSAGGGGVGRVGSQAMDLGPGRGQGSYSAAGGAPGSGGTAGPLPPQRVTAPAAPATATGNIEDVRAQNALLQQQVAELQRRLEAMEQAAKQAAHFPPRTSATRHSRHLSAANIPTSSSLPPHVLMDMSPALLQGTQHHAATPTRPTAWDAATRSGSVATPTSAQSMVRPIQPRVSVTPVAIPDLPAEPIMPLGPTQAPPAAHPGGSDADGEGEHDPRAPLVQVQHPFASAVTTSPGGPAESLGSASSSVAGVVQAAGPAMLRTKAATILQSRHRRVQSVDVSRLSLAVSSPTSNSQGFQTFQQPISSWLRASANSTSTAPADDLDGAAAVSATLPVTRANTYAGTRTSLGLLGVASPRVGPTTPTTLHGRKSTSLSGGGSNPHGRGGSGDHSLPSFGGAIAPQVTGRAHYSATIGGVPSGPWEVGPADMPPIRSQPSFIHPTQEVQPQVPLPAPATAAAAGVPAQYPHRQQRMDEFESGVYLFLRRPSPDAPEEVWKVKFSRQIFTQDAAKAWWHNNAGRVEQRYPVRLQVDPAHGSNGGASESGPSPQTRGAHSYAGGSSSMSDAGGTATGRPVYGASPTHVQGAEMVLAGQAGVRGSPGTPLASALGTGVAQEAAMYGGGDTGRGHHTGPGLVLQHVTGSGSVVLASSPGSLPATPATITTPHSRSLAGMDGAPGSRGLVWGGSLGAPLPTELPAETQAWLAQAGRGSGGSGTGSGLPPRPLLLGPPNVEVPVRRVRPHHQRSRSGSALPQHTSFL